MRNAFDGSFKVGIPLTEKIVTGDGTRYLVDLTGDSPCYFLQRGEEIYLDMEFYIAGVKIPPDDPRPVGVPIGKCTIQMTEISAKDGLIKIPENVAISGEFAEPELKNDGLKNASFRMLIPIRGAVISPTWEGNK